MLAYLLKSFWFALLPFSFTQFHFDQPAMNCVDRQNRSTVFTKQNIPQELHAQAHCTHIFKEFTKSKYCESVQFWVCWEFACAFWRTNIQNFDERNWKMLHLSWFARHLPICVRKCSRVVVRVFNLTHLHWFYWIPLNAFCTSHSLCSRLMRIFDKICIIFHKS